MKSKEMSIGDRISRAVTNEVRVIQERSENDNGWWTSAPTGGRRDFIHDIDVDRMWERVEEEEEARRPLSDVDADALRKARDVLIALREQLEEAEGGNPFNQMIVDWHAWMEEYQPHIRKKDPSVEGSSCSCRICGDEIDGVPTTSFHEIMVPLPHDHAAFIRADVRSTAQTRGAVCGKCLTFGMMSIFFTEGSWADKTYSPIVIPDLGQASSE